MEIRKADNCRLSNIMDPVFTMMSPWKEIFPWLNGLLCAASIYLIIRIARIKRDLTATTALIWFAVVVCLPWRNSMFITDYALNYVFPAFLTLAFIYIVCNTDIRNWSIPTTMAVALFAMPVGAWHEGFFVPAICGFGVWGLSRRFRLSWKWWLIMITYSATALVFALSPGMLTRAFREITVEPREVPLWEIIYDLATCAFVAFIYIRASLSAKGRKLLKTSCGDQAFVVLTVAAFVGIIISLAVTHRPRTVFWPNLCVIASLTIFASKYISTTEGRKQRKLRATVTVAAIAAMLFCVAHGAYCLIWQYRFHKENEVIMGQVEAGVNEVYCDRLHRHSPRVLTLCFPTSHIWIPFHYRALGERIGRHIAVVPTALRNVRLTPPDSLGGNIRALRTGDAIWIDGTALAECSEQYLNISFNDGTSPYKYPCLVRHFATADGDSISYIDLGRIDPLTVSAISRP